MNNAIKLAYDQLYKNNPGVLGDGSLIFLQKVLKENENIFSIGRALDIGSGDGQTSEYLAKEGFVVDSVDLSDEAFKAILSKENIFLYNLSISDFIIRHDYNLVNIALVAHHLSNEVMASVLKNLQDNTVKGGVHIYRIFTTNSGFYLQSEGRGFYDNGTNLNEQYKDWEIVLEAVFIGQASTQDIKNEVREVVFKKK